MIKVQVNVDISLDDLQLKEASITRDNRNSIMKTADRQVLPTIGIVKSKVEQLDAMGFIFE